MLLILFAFVAGMGTALSPCVLPVLPALLSAGATGGRRRPLGIVLGLTVTFAVTIIGLATVVDGVGLGASATRTIAIVTLAAFGIAVAFPAVGDRLEAPLSRLARFGPRSGGDGFRSGLVVGGALGFLYAPCAGPILAAVIVVGAGSGRAVGVGIAYAAGSGAVLLLLALGGRALADRVRAAGRGPQVRQVLGVVMILTAVAMAADLDVRFQTAIARHLPSALVNPTKAIEDSGAARRELQALRGPSKFSPRARDRRPDGPIIRAPRARDGPRLHRDAALVQHARRPPADARGPARAGRARRLLDVHLHQLHPHAALPHGVGPALPRRRPDDRRRALARVPVREGRRERRGGDPPESHRLPGRPGQRPRHLERLGQPVLARALPDRRPRKGARRPLRRGRLRHDRGGHPRAAARAWRPRRRRDARGRPGRSTPRRRRRPRRTSERRERRATPATGRRETDAAPTRPRPGRWRSTRSRCRGPGRRTASTPWPAPGLGSTRQCRARTSISSCHPRQAHPDASPCSSTDDRSPRPRPATTCAAASWTFEASGSTTSFTCAPWGATA